jgi:hypothetical protein
VLPKRQHKRSFSVLTAHDRLRPSPIATIGWKDIISIEAAAGAAIAIHDHSRSTRAA